MTLTLHPVGALGAEVSGVNLKDLAPAQAQELKQALRRHGVLFFRKQTLAPEE